MNPPTENATTQAGTARPRISQLPTETVVTSVVIGSIDAQSHSVVLRGVARIALRFLLLSLLAILLDLLISTGLHGISTSRFGVWNRIVDGNIDAQILITGSSRALNHFDPRPIQARIGYTAFNIGLNGSQTDMQLARFRTYLRHNEKPLLLIHNLDLFSFQITHGGVYDPGQYVPYIREEPIYHALKRINPESWKSKYLPLYGYAVEDLRFSWLDGLRAALGSVPQEDHVLGFMPRDLQWTGDFERFKASHRDGLRVEVEPAGVRELEELLQLCHQERIPVLLVYSPEYREMQSMTSNRAEIFEQFRVLSARFGAVFWDYSDSPMSGNRDLFYNSQHLNSVGASAFSAELATRIALDTEFKLLSRAGVRRVQ